MQEVLMIKIKETEKLRSISPDLMNEFRFRYKPSELLDDWTCAWCTWAIYHLTTREGKL